MFEAMLLLLCLLSCVNSQEVEFKDWKPYESKVVIPQVIDLRSGGSIDMMMGAMTHTWGAGMELPVDMYGYKLVDDDSATVPTYPGPTILVSKNVPVEVTWINNISAPHLLDRYIARQLLMPPSACYPLCGVPLITHVHGLEVPAKYDGVPNQAIYTSQSKKDVYTNRQMSSTHAYHDHAMGLTRLNHWAGLVGGYIIEDSEVESARGIVVSFDIPLLLSDTLVSTEGVLMYTKNPCETTSTHWAPESYGNVNAVNGVVMPIVEVPRAEAVELRLINGANSRGYGLDIPFFRSCSIIGKDMALLNTPVPLTSPDEIVFFPLERVDLFCNFSEIEEGSVYNVTNTLYPEGTEQLFTEVFQLKIVASSATLLGMKDPVVGSEASTVGRSRKPRDADSLNHIKDLAALHESTGGRVRNIALEEVTNEEDCPVKLLIKVENQTSTFENHNYVSCHKGKVEKWVFTNPTADVHPFHWHAISVQCGPTEAEINSNELKDTVQIPSAEEDYETVVQVCYVACVPNAFLEEGSTVGPTEFDFSTEDPYVFHCHIMPHEENAMMTYFFLADDDDQFSRDPAKMAKTFPRARTDLKIDPS